MGFFNFFGVLFFFFEFQNEEENYYENCYDFVDFKGQDVDDFQCIENCQKNYNDKKNVIGLFFFYFRYFLLFFRQSFFEFEQINFSYYVNDFFGFILNKNCRVIFKEVFDNFKVFIFVNDWERFFYDFYNFVFVNVVVFKVLVYECFFGD